MTIQLQYDTALIEQFPSTIGGILYADNFTNTPTSAALQAIYQQEQAEVKQRIGNTPISQLETLAAWRETFSAFGVPPSRYRSASESLLRRLTKKGDIPVINSLVDIGNLVSIRYGLPIAMFDARIFTSPITVRFATGGEQFTALHMEEPEHPAAGEVIFVDAHQEVCARRWCWRQSAASASRDDTTAVVITIEAQHPDGRNSVVSAVQDMQALLAAHLGASSTAKILDTQNQTFILKN